jgi:hypothetical protein
MTQIGERERRKLSKGYLLLKAAFLKGLSLRLCLTTSLSSKGFIF